LQENAAEHTKAVPLEEKTDQRNRVLLGENRIERAPYDELEEDLEDVCSLEVIIRELNSARGAGGDVGGITEDRSGG
jgi:hypothetical protein